MSQNNLRSHGRGENLKTAIAATAARHIAEEGCDYGTAKRRAARELLGDGAAPASAIPDNLAVESELRRYLRLFAADTQPGELAALRRLALVWMRRLAAFDPHLVGAVLNGTATAHSPVLLNLYADSAKDVEMLLLNRHQPFDVTEPASHAETLLEALHLEVPAPPGSPLAQRVALVLSVMDPRALRVAPPGRPKDPELHPVERSGRASLAMVERLLAETGAGGAVD